MMAIKGANVFQKVIQSILLWSRFSCHVSDFDTHYTVFLWDRTIMLDWRIFSKEAGAVQTVSSLHVLLAKFPLSL